MIVRRQIAAGVFNFLIYIRLLFYNPAKFTK